MKKASASDDDYIIFVKYKDIDDLKNIVYEILAVQKFQTSRGLKQDGIVGPLTITQLLK